MKTTSCAAACGIEPLESRIAPASLTFTDADGDKVVVTTSGAGVLQLGGNVLVGGGSIGIDLTVAGGQFQGANVSIVATRNAATGGDGFVNVAYINAFGFDLGAVLVDGDLGTITCGDATTDTGFGLKSLSVQSIGHFGTAGGGHINADGTLASRIIGALGTLKIKGDLKDVWLRVTGNAAGDEAHGTIGSVTIGGSITGGSTFHAGSIESSGDIGVVKITHDIKGGSGLASGFIQSDSGRIKSVTLGGSLLGGSNQFTGQIRSGSDLGPVKITGNVEGGTVSTSGFIASFTGFGPDDGTMASITIGGSLLGGAVFESGHIHSIGAMGPVKIGHDVKGGAGFKSGYIASDAAMGSVKIGGALLGGTGTDSGEIFANGMGAVTIVGSILGTKTDPGGAHSRSGVLESLGAMGAVKIGGDVDGGVLDFSGYIHSTGRLAALSITGSLLGGAGDHTARLAADEGVAGRLKIGKDVKGGTGANSGIIFDGGMAATSGKLGAVFIGGSFSGDDSVPSGRISLGTNQLVATSLTIKGDVAGGSILGADIGKISIGGSMTSGFMSFYGAVGSISIGKDLGSLAGGARIFVVGHDATTDHPSIAIKSLTIGRNVLNSSIMAGWGGIAQNPDAQIGTVKVGGDWTASDLVAGVTAGTDIYFGDANDVAISQAGEPDAFFSKIASIVIGGNVIGGPGGPDHNGFVAQQIGSFKSLGFTAPLTTGTDRDTAIPGTSTIRIVEVI